MSADILNQHVIDPEICIRCNTCEDTCPVGAVTHNADNYVVDPEKCNFCMDCISPCPTGSIDNWRKVPKSRAYTLEQQFEWEELPQELSTDELNQEADSSIETAPEAISSHANVTPQIEIQTLTTNRLSATTPPWSAAHAYTNLYGPKSTNKSITAKVVGNVRVTKVGPEYDTHHIVLDFGQLHFPVLEGQSIGILPPGLDAKGKPHHARQYSVASPRNGERLGYNNLSLTVKRVLEDYDGNAVRGVGSNYMCDLNVGNEVEVIGPFGSSFLMPNHSGSNIVMICTGTGSAPMRAMTEWRRRLYGTDKFESGKLMLFFGARTPEDLPYFGPLKKLPKDFIDINLAFSRVPGQPKCYVQDAMRNRAADLGTLLNDPNSSFYVCGIKKMEEGVVLALQEIADKAGVFWETLSESLKKEGRLHFETY